MYETNISRRTALKLVGASSIAGLAGCLDDTSGDDSTPEENVGTLPSQEEGAEMWGEMLNEHAEDAGIDWQQFEGEDIELNFRMGLHPYSTVTEQVIPAFEELTGITVNYHIDTEENYWREARNALQTDGEFDGAMVGLWQAGELHEAGLLYDLNEFIEDASLTDQDWLHMEDFLDQTIELMSFPSPEGQNELVGFPNGIEAYGAVGYDEPTFEMLGLEEPETFEDVRHAAQTIAEDDQVAPGDNRSRAGIISRTSTTVLSSANWGTMFKTFGGNWIDRDSLEATLNSEEGIASLELFGEMMHEYGPDEPGTYDWYRANDALANEEVGILYSTPSTSGAISEEQIERTKWVPPLPGPDGGDPVVDTWVWSTGIAQNSDNPEAAWLFIQWANSRLGNFMLSTRQWEGHDPRAGYARLDYVAEGYEDAHPDLDLEPHGITDSFLNAHREGMSNVPSSPPPVPVDTPQNMNIMGEAAVAMNEVVIGVSDAETALNNAADPITEYAKKIPPRYLEYLN